MLGKFMVLNCVPGDAVLAERTLCLCLKRHGYQHGESQFTGYKLVIGLALMDVCADARGGFRRWDSSLRLID